MAKKPKMAGEKTRQLMRDAGLPAELCDQEGLTLSEANQALRDAAVREELAMHGEPPAKDPITGLRCQVLLSDDGTTSEVKGESHYIKWLSKLTSSLKSEGNKAFGWAVLVPEPENKYDSNAVAVYINGGQVGYVPSETAKQIIGHLLNAKANHRAVYCTRATLYTGPNGGIGVWLSCDLDDLPYEPRPAPETSSPGCGVLVLLALLLVLAGFCVLTMFGGMAASLSSSPSRRSNVEAQSPSAPPPQSFVGRIYLVRAPLTAYSLPGSAAGAREATMAAPLRVTVTDWRDFNGTPWLSLNLSRWAGDSVTCYVAVDQFAQLDKTEASLAEASAALPKGPTPPQ